MSTETNPGELREQRLARIEAQMNAAWARYGFGFHPVDAKWLFGEARRVTQLEAELSRAKDENERLERHRATWQDIAESNSSIVDEVRIERDAAVAALARIEQRVDELAVLGEMYIAIFDVRRLAEVADTGGAIETTEAEAARDAAVIALTRIREQRDVISEFGEGYDALTVRQVLLRLDAALGVGVADTTEADNDFDHLSDCIDRATPCPDGCTLPDVADQPEPTEPTLTGLRATVRIPGIPGNDDEIFMVGLAELPYALASREDWWEGSFTIEDITPRCDHGFTGEHGEDVENGELICPGPLGPVVDEKTDKEQK